MKKRPGAKSCKCWPINAEIVQFHDFKWDSFTRLVNVIILPFCCVFLSAVPICNIQIYLLSCHGLLLLWSTELQWRIYNHCIILVARYIWELVEVLCFVVVTPSVAMTIVPKQFLMSLSDICFKSRLTDDLRILNYSITIFSIFTDFN